MIGSKRYGVLFVGIGGCTASTFTHMYHLNLKNRERLLAGTYLKQHNISLPDELFSLIIGGWECRYQTLDEAVEANRVVKDDIDIKRNVVIYPGIIGASDHISKYDGFSASFTNFSDAIEAIRSNIRDFKQNAKLDRVFVINCSSPKFCDENSVKEGWASADAYAHGTILEGEDWVEFTPSDTINKVTIDLSKNTGSRLLGRDGSTGQTITKMVLHEYLVDRGFEIESWYSTNLIGNRDGLVLGNPEYCNTKIKDKKDAIQLTNDDKHIVDIRYLPPYGDNKESWDCIMLSGWDNKGMSMRINWQGMDSYLAGGLLLDILFTLIIADINNCDSGILKEAGLFFKRSLGYEKQPRYSELIDAWRHFISK